MEQHISVVALVNPRLHPVDDSQGLLCKARMGQQDLVVALGDVERDEGSRNSQLIDDYWFWLWNWRAIV